MDDTCAVCAESLEWVAYGSCGHKEVCSTCVARLRFICSDRRCCICKSESTLIFVTKALGDYTKMINDFSVFPSEDKEGRSGSYWYHEDTQAYFDDLDQYKMVKAMCRLSCSVCDKVEENGSNSSKRRARFRNIDQLKGHLFHQHKLLMCSLCLEGRKVFICEQKLYSRAQLKQHINTGDSEVDGTESERGGFKGHPLCEFCRSPFYGDNELYTHMSTEHYTCHICQRQNPGQYEYYKNYDDLEIHFRQEHFLCEDEACLSKKFIVFTSEAEMKRHNALEHGGRMSRSKRNAALQLPTSFRYRRSNEQDNRRGRFQRDLSEDELSRAIEASLETANVNGRFLDSSSSSLPVASDHTSINGIDPLIQPFEALGTESDPRYLMAVSHRPRNAPLEESSFPPLSSGPGGSTQRPIHDAEGLPRNTMADNLRRHSKKKVNVLNTAQAWPAATRFNNPPASSAASRPANTSHGSSVVPGHGKSAINQRSAASSQPSSLQVLPSVGSSTSSSRNSTSRIGHSSSAPNLVDTVSVSDFPPVSTLQARNPPASGQVTRGTGDVYTANKTMVEKIRAGLDNDQDKYAAFKDISAEYRQGVIDAEMYLVYVEQFGLSHLVLELARLCPDPRKEQELIAVYNANQSMSGQKRNGQKNGMNNSKGKSVVSGNNKLTDSILSSVRELQSNYRPPEEEVETLSKDGYRAANKGKLKLEVDDRTSPGSVPRPKSEGGGDGEGRSKPQQQRKKTSKFHRVRLGNGSMASILDLTNSNAGSDSTEASNGNGNEDPGDGVPVRGVWRNGGGHRLIVKDQRRP
ncbi:E3 ubiquitin-protein ligase hel2 isoform X1 [Cynara cardunculus var. scolymus]|uniref:E3 ubiquitin-protein ligase hel2 isoform X1 n=1 Tax=Cynara cardunculus var. scolymus TaxID=59895 RepID=UPI000D63089D|nr:E3 ubiquitin-protein ligase hel2 isoform X1 [Cynara cardunculus var. scolymus]